MPTRLLILVFALLSIIAMVGCNQSTPSNLDPQINRLWADHQSVPTRDTVWIHCDARDVEGGALTYEWSATGGSFTGDSANVAWLAPDRPGIYAITCIVQDVDNNTASATINMTIFPFYVLMLKRGPTAEWLAPFQAGSQDTEFRWFGGAGLTVDARDLNVTPITDSTLANYDIVRLHTTDRPFTPTEGAALYNWVRAGGRLMIDISHDLAVYAVRQFGVDRIDGNHGGVDGTDWFFHGAPWVFAPVTGPAGSVTSMAAETMDRPVLAGGHGLTIDATFDSFPVIAHGEFGDGRVIIIFATNWSQDQTDENSPYRATIYLLDNTRFLENCISYLKAPYHPN